MKTGHLIQSVLENNVANLLYVHDVRN